MFQLTADESRCWGAGREIVDDAGSISAVAQCRGEREQSEEQPPAGYFDGRYAAFDALEALRAKGLVARVDTVGSRTNKYKHNAADILSGSDWRVGDSHRVLLRGPQTLGELRGRASRMHPLASLEEVKRFVASVGGARRATGP